MKLGKLKDVVEITYKIVIELGKFVNFIKETDLDEQYEFLGKNLPLVSSGLLVLEKLFWTLAKIFGVELEDTSVQSISDEDRFKTIIDRAEELLEEIK